MELRLQVGCIVMILQGRNFSQRTSIVFFILRKGMENGEKDSFCK